MQMKDYRRLAKISLKSRKKSTRSTIVGIAFGLILLMPIIFLGVGLNADLKSTINKTPELLYAEVEHHSTRSNAPDDIGTEENYYSDALLGSKAAVRLRDVGEYTVQYKLLYNQSFNQGRNDVPLIKYSIGNADLIRAPRLDDTSPSGNANLAVVSGDIDILENVIDPFLLEGYDSGFIGDGKGQIMLNQQFLTALGLEPSQVYGKEFSLFFRDTNNSGSIMFDNDNNPTNDFDRDLDVRQIDEYLYKNYQVMGIVKGANPNSNRSDSLVDQAMITTDASLYNDSGEVVAPVYNVQTFENGVDDTYDSYVATYDMTVEELSARSEEYIRTGIDCYSMMRLNDNNYDYDELGVLIDTQFTRIQASDYAALDSIVKTLAMDYENVFGDRSSDYFLGTTSDAFSTFNFVYTMFNYVFLVLSAVGCIILFSAIVNLFNTIMHSVQSRKNYLGVMRAIGATPSTIPKLYLFETMRIFRRALTWVLFIGCGMCVGIKIGLDYAFIYMSEMLGITLGISWAYIPIAFFGLTLLLAICGVAFSYFCSRSISKQAITQVLEG